MPGRLAARNFDSSPPKLKGVFLGTLGLLFLECGSDFDFCLILCLQLLQPPAGATSVLLLYSLSRFKRDNTQHTEQTAFRFFFEVLNFFSNFFRTNWHTPKPPQLVMHHLPKNYKNQNSKQKCSHAFSLKQAGRASPSFPLPLDNPRGMRGPSVTNPSGPLRPYRDTKTTQNDNRQKAEKCKPHVYLRINTHRLSACAR